MKSVGLTQTGRDFEVRPAKSSKQAVGDGSSQTFESHLKAATIAPGQTEAIKAAWSQYADSNPGELTRLMEQYGVSAADMAAATGKSHGAVGDMIHRAGRAQGFAGTTYFDPAAGVLTDASAYNTWSYMPTDTYAQYVEKVAAEKNDPLSAWLGAGYPMLSETEWNAQGARIAVDKARGLSFDATSIAGQKLLAGPQLASVPTQPVQVNSQLAQVANASQPVLAVSQQALSDALETWSSTVSKSNGTT